MFSIASAVTAGPSGTRSRTNAALAGSLAKSPERRQVADRVAGNDGGERRRETAACAAVRGTGVHAAARIANRSPASATMTTKPQPTWLEAAPDFRRSDLPDQPREEHQAEHGRDDAGQSSSGADRASGSPGFEWHAVII